CVARAVASSLVVIFFFQAEDGIRDATVTGVQTCALPISWTDNSGVEDGFTLWRAGGGADWSVVATLPANTTVYHDAGLTPDNTYWYVVYATKDGGSSGSSESVQVVLATTPPVAASDLGVQPTSDRKSTRLNSSHGSISYA